MTSSLIRSILVLCLAVPAMALSGDQQTTAQAAEPTRQDYLQQIHALQTSFRERAPSADERQRFYALVEAMQTSGDDQLRDNNCPTSRDLMCRKAICLPTYVSGPPTRGRGSTWKAPEPSITSITRCRTEGSLPPRKPCQFL